MSTRRDLDTFRAMPPSFRCLLPWLCVVLLSGCPLPRPESVDVEVEVGDREVVFDARFGDLRVPGDQLLAFRTTGTVLTQAQAAKAMRLPPWISSIDTWTVSETHGHLDLHVVARTTRATFDRCSASPCSGREDEACERWPLRRSCMPQVYGELARDSEPYVATEASAREWPADARHLRFALRRGPSPRAADMNRSAATVWALFSDRGAAVQALEWMDRVDVAGALKPDALAPPPVLGAPLDALMLERQLREQQRRWYRLLAGFDPRWLEPPLPGAVLDLREPLPAPTPRPPAAWRWHARTAYEIWRRTPSAYDELSRELCGERWIAKHRDLSAFCERVGARPP